MTRRRVALALAAALAATGGASSKAANAKPPAAVETFVGRFAVEDAHGKRLCVATLSWELTVGGQVSAESCAKAAPDLDEALRFYADDANGGIVLEDALHARRGHADEDEAGIFATLASGVRVRFQPLDPAPPLSPAQVAQGRWAPVDRDGSRLGKGCALNLRAGGAIALSGSCPKSWLRFAAGRWQATRSRLTLAPRPRAGGKPMAFEIGGDPTVLFGPKRAVQLERIDPWSSR